MGKEMSPTLKSHKVCFVSSQQRSRTSRDVLIYSFHTLIAETQAFVCVAGEHKWEASEAKYIKMTNFS